MYALQEGESAFPNVHSRASTQSSTPAFFGEGPSHAPHPRPCHGARSTRRLREHRRDHCEQHSKQPRDSAIHAVNPFHREKRARNVLAALRPIPLDSGQMTGTQKGTWLKKLERKCFSYRNGAVAGGGLKTTTVDTGLGSSSRFIWLLALKYLTEFGDDNERCNTKLPMGIVDTGEKRTMQPRIT